MTDQPETHTLAEAERRLKSCVTAGKGYAMVKVLELRAVMQEYDRRGELLAARDAELDDLEAIVRAAFRLAESYDPHSTDEVDGDLLAALIREVRR